MPLDAEDTVSGTPKCDVTRYSSLGLIANPFIVPADVDDDPAVASEVAAAGNLLLKAIRARSLEDAPRPLVVLKAQVPASYTLQAMSSIEPHLATDDALGVLYAYVPLFSMRIGAVRSTLGVIAERLAFRDFETTLTGYIASVLSEPDVSLPSHAALGDDRLGSFATRFAQDGPAAVRSVFGVGALELHPELAEVADLRQADLSEDVDESDSSPEVDSSLGDSPASALLAAQATERIAEENTLLFDYFIEYTAAHLSPVIARSLRVYRDRGLAAFAAELRVTKAPRKTLMSILKLASIRFVKSALIYDGFESWLDVPDDTRSAMVGSLSEMRWKTAGLAFPVFLLTPGEAPEVEETFGASGTVRWDFGGLFTMQDQPGVILPEVVDSWVEAATIGESGRFTCADPVLEKLLSAADGSFGAFIRMAHQAVESAADRAAGSLDTQALDAALAAG